MKWHRGKCLRCARCLFYRIKNSLHLSTKKEDEREKVQQILLNRIKMYNTQEEHQLMN